MRITTAAPRTTATITTASRLVTAFFLMLSTLAFLRPARSFVAEHSFRSSRIIPRHNRRGATTALSFVTITLRGGSAGGGDPYSTTTSLAMADSKPFAVVVTAEIQADRMDEFLDMIQFNAENSRKEPGCVRFGV